MLSKDSRFRRLPVRARGIGGSASYWLGPDHLLVVTMEGYHERYRRVDYRDIRAVIIRRTNTWLLLLLLGLVLMIVTGILPLASGDPAGQVMGSIFLVLSLILVVIQLVAGPTCSCRLITAVQRRDLPYLNRWRQASRLLEELQSEVNRAQHFAPATAAEETEPAADPTGLSRS